MTWLVFVLLTVVALASAVMVITQKNPVYSALFLVLNMLSLAGFYVTLGAPVVAAVQVIVYAGAIVVLFLFVVMLLDLRKSIARDRSLGYEGLLAIALGSLFVFTMLLVFWGASPPAGGTVSAVNGTMEQIGKGLFQKWVYPLEVCSVLLLAAIIGVVVLANKEAGQGK